MPISVTDMFNFTVWAIIFFILIVQFFKSIRLVPQKYTFIVERLGKYHKSLNAGFHALIPFVDSVTYQLDLKEQTIDVPPQECFTFDEIRVTIDGVIYISVMDAAKAAYGITDFRYAAMQLAQTTTRAIIGKLELDRTFEEREQISARVIEVLEETSREWGIRVHRYEIKNIVPPQSVNDAMEKQVTAERERQAILAKANGNKQARINRSEGLKTKMINESEGFKQKQINEAEGLSAEIRALADATAESIEKVANAINTENGESAIRLQLAERYLNRFSGVAKADTDILLPCDLTNFGKVMESAGFNAPQGK